MDDRTQALWFTLFNEIGILGQLSRAAFDARLPDGVTTAHFSILNHLIRVADGRTPLELARAFQVPKTSMTHTLSGLEQRGLIEMRRNPRDGRSKRVWLTGEGRHFRDAAIARLAPDFAALAERFPAGAIADLAPRLAEIRAFLDARRDEGNQAEPDRAGQTGISQ